MAKLCLFSLCVTLQCLVFFRCGFSVCYLPRSHCNAPWVVGVGGYLLHHAADSRNRQRGKDTPTNTLDARPFALPVRSPCGIITHIHNNLRRITAKYSEHLFGSCLKKRFLLTLFQTLLCFFCRWVGWNQSSLD